MNKRWREYVLVTGFLLVIIACKKNSETSLPTVIKANGDIAAKLNEFRTILGNLNTTTGAIGGRREIDWDAVPDDMLGKKLPTDFFNPVGTGAIPARQRGLGYTDAGAFMVSKTNFAEINAEAATEFSAFSGTKTFANASASLWHLTFEVAGQRTAATINGFGAVFADVDKENSTYIELLNNDKSIGKYYVPVQGNGTKFSFLGVYFKNERITSVRVGHEGRLSDQGRDLSQGGTADLVILDDFLYSEPVAK
jgi:hypothetical protein